jgi:hypothetical protein
VKVTVMLPACASFSFFPGHLEGTKLADGRLYRNDTISYEVPEAYLYPISPRWTWDLPFYLGQKMTVHVRPKGPARFIIQDRGPHGIAWFDTR